jgi:hypothetical protein
MILANLFQDVQKIASDLQPKVIQQVIDRRLDEAKQWEIKEVLLFLIRKHGCEKHFVNETLDKLYRETLWFHSISLDSVWERLEIYLQEMSRYLKISDLPQEWLEQKSEGELVWENEGGRCS